MTYDNSIRFAEVMFYFLANINEEKHALAVIKLFSPPDNGLLQASSGAVLCCDALEEYVVVKIQNILSVVAMIPHHLNGQLHHFVVERMGLDIAFLTGTSETINEE